MFKENVVLAMPHLKILNRAKPKRDHLSATEINSRLLVLFLSQVKWPRNNPEVAKIYIS